MSKAAQWISIITIKDTNEKRGKHRLDQRVFGCYKQVTDERADAIRLFMDDEKTFTQQLIVKVDGEVIEQANIDVDGNVTVTTEVPTQCISCQYTPPEGSPVYEEGRCPNCQQDVAGVDAE